MPKMDFPAYLNAIATQLASELSPVLGVKEVTSNPDLLGRFTEAAVRNLVNRIVHPMRVCSGAVIDEPMPEKLRQIDLIIWAPFPAPAIFEVEGFGLVPKSSAFGVIEVKRSNYSGSDEQLEGFWKDVETRKIVSGPNGPWRDFMDPAPGLGIVCVLDHTPSSKLKSLLEKDQAIAIFERQGEMVCVRRRDVIVLAGQSHLNACSLLAVQ